MALQEEMTLGDTSTPAQTALNARLSRIVAKLFAKVMKAEDAKPQPFRADSFDLQSLLCALEDMLVAVQDAQRDQKVDNTTACRDMAKTLMASIVKSGSFSVSEIKDQMEQLGIDSVDSALAILLDSVSPRPDIKFSPFRSQPSPSVGSVPDVAALVSAVGGAEDGPERDEAVKALRSYRAVHGDVDLHAHLDELSPAFRLYILDQLDPKEPSPAKTADGPMAERLRNLRSKLSAVEASVKTESASSSPSKIPFSRSPRSAPAAASSSTMPRPAPTGATSVMNLRQRLAAAQESRSASTRDVEATTNRSSSASNQAASLRARLEAVKNQTRR